MPAATRPRRSANSGSLNDLEGVNGTAANIKQTPGGAGRKSKASPGKPTDPLQSASAPSASGTAPGGAFPVPSSMVPGGAGGSQAAAGAAPGKTSVENYIAAMDARLKNAAVGQPRPIHAQSGPSEAQSPKSGSGGPGVFGAPPFTAAGHHPLQAGRDPGGDGEGGPAPANAGPSYYPGSGTYSFGAGGPSTAGPSNVYQPFQTNASFGASSVAGPSHNPAGGLLGHKRPREDADIPMDPAITGSQLAVEAGDQDDSDPMDISGAVGDEIEGDAGAGGDEGEEGGKKKNKKITSERRKQQNRIAQRNFRERKERQAKQNEVDLVQRNSEVSQLRALVEALDAENSFLRSHVPPTILSQLPPPPNIAQIYTFGRSGSASTSTPGAGGQTASVGSPSTSKKGPKGGHGEPAASTEETSEHERAANTLSALAANAAHQQQQQQQHLQDQRGALETGPTSRRTTATTTSDAPADPDLLKDAQSTATMALLSSLVQHSNEPDRPPQAYYGSPPLGQAAQPWERRYTMNTDDLGSVEAPNAGVTAALPEGFGSFWDLYFPPTASGSGSGSGSGTGTGSGPSPASMVVAVPRPLSPQPVGPIKRHEPTTFAHHPHALTPPAGSDRRGSGGNQVDHARDEDHQKLSETTTAEADALGRIAEADRQAALITLGGAHPQPPAVGPGEMVRDMLRGTQAWGKLLTHPLKEHLDLDELARAMQKRARLYNGQPVLTQQDLIVIWDSIPRRVEGRMLGYRLGDDGRDEVELGD